MMSLFSKPTDKSYPIRWKNQITKTQGMVVARSLDENLDKMN